MGGPKWREKSSLGLFRSLERWQSHSVQPQKAITGITLIGHFVESIFPIKIQGIEAQRKKTMPKVTQGFLRGCSGKEPTCQCKRCKRPMFDPWVRKIPWRRKWQPTPVFLPGQSHGQRSLVGCSLWDHKELDMTEAT